MFSPTTKETQHTTVTSTCTRDVGDLKWGELVSNSRDIQVNNSLLLASMSRELLTNSSHFKFDDEVMGLYSIGHGRHVHTYTHRCARLTSLY